MEGSQNTYTLADFIEYKSDDNINYYNFSVNKATEDKNILFSVKNVIDDYLDELIDNSVYCELSDAEVKQYQYKPWLLSYYLYKDTELYFIIMLINNIYDPRDFEDIHKIRLIKYSVLIEILNSITNSEYDFISNMKEELQ